MGPPKSLGDHFSSPLLSMAKIKPRLLPKMMVPLLSTTGEEYTQSALIVVGLKLQSGPLWKKMSSEGWNGEMPARPELPRHVGHGEPDK